MILKYADKSLKKDKDVVLAALKQNIHSIEYADKIYKDLAFKNVKVDRKKLGELADYLLSFKKVVKNNKIRLKNIFSKVDYDYNIKDIYGNSIKIKITKSGLKIYGLENKILMMNFFGTKLPISRLNSIRRLGDKLKENFKDDLEIISIEVQGASIKELEEIVLKSRMKDIVVSYGDAKKFMKFIRGNTSFIYLPYILTIDKKGNLADMISYSKLQKDDFSKFIQNLR